MPPRVEAAVVYALTGTNLLVLIERVLLVIVCWWNTHVRVCLEAAEEKKKGKEACI